MKIVIYVHGGMVQEVRADSLDVDVEVVDYDDQDAAAAGWDGYVADEPEKPAHVVW